VREGGVTRYGVEFSIVEDHISALRCIALRIDIFKSDPDTLALRRNFRVETLISIRFIAHFAEPDGVCSVAFCDLARRGPCLRGQWRQPPVIEDQKPDFSPGQMAKRFAGLF
jgi:hypothetical protein